MRNLIVTMAALAWIAACGPSGRELAQAKTARYHGDKLALFSGVKTATEAKYKLEVSDETTLSVVTTGRWYTPDGLASSWKPGDGKLADNSLSVQLVVKLLPDGSNWIVDVEPVILRYRVGQPNLEKIARNDPSLYGWVPGKVDQLAYDIYTALKPYERKGPGGLPPPPTESPTAPAAPAEPTAPVAPATEPTGSTVPSPSTR